MNRFTTVIAMLTLAMIQQSAHAGAPANESSQVTVRFADLDLDHTAGAAAMYQRLVHAAELVCSPFEGRDLASKVHFGRCMDESVAASIAKVDRPVLTQYFRSKIGGSTAPVLLAKK